MKSVNIKILSMVMFMVILFSLPVLAESMAKYNLDENIPDSWFDQPIVASEEGVTEFDESPLLKVRVAAGELEPVEDRLPDDPLCIEPYKEIGKYGGMAHVYVTNQQHFDAAGGWVPFHRRDMMVRANPTMTEYIPRLFESMEYNEDYTQLTIHMRKGMKWSDGYPLTTKNTMWWWEHVANNKELNPVPPEKQNPPIKDIKALDDYTFVITFMSPQPKAHRGWFNTLEFGFGTPAHYMKNYHIETVEDRNTFLREVKEEGFDNWTQYWEYHNTLTNVKAGIRPSFDMYITVERGEDYLIRERNPYYYVVDTEGNQLPYIDKIMVHLITNNDVAEMKAVTGEATINYTSLSVDSLPLYQSQQEKGGYDLLVWKDIKTTWCNLQPNLTHENPKLRKIFQDIRFRRALSLSINRNEINEKLFYGEGTPSAATISRTSKYYKPEYGHENPYIKYNPEEAIKLLDEIGMKDINNDGFRELPDGSVFNPEIITLAGDSRDSILEIVVDNFKSVGLNIDLKILNWGLHLERKHANKFDIGGWSSEDTDLLIQYEKNLAPWDHNTWHPNVPWILWIDWFVTNGDSGEEPPEEIKKLIKLADIHVNKWGSKEADQALEELLQISAKKMWNIGTVAAGPAPIIKSKNLKNVTKTGVYYWAAEFLRPYYECQFYLDE